MPAESVAQRKLAAMALKYKKGEMPNASKEVKNMAKMSVKELEKFATTPERGLPQHVEESNEKVISEGDKIIQELEKNKGFRQGLVRSICNMSKKLDAHGNGGASNGNKSKTAKNESVEVSETKTYCERFSPANLKKKPVKNLLKIMNHLRRKMKKLKASPIEEDITVKAAAVKTNPDIMNQAVMASNNGAKVTLENKNKAKKTNSTQKVTPAMPGVTMKEDATASGPGLDIRAQRALGAKYKENINKLIAKGYTREKATEMLKGLSPEQTSALFKRLGLTENKLSMGMKDIKKAVNESVLGVVTKGELLEYIAKANRK